MLSLKEKQAQSRASPCSNMKWLETLTSDTCPRRPAGALSSLGLEPDQGSHGPARKVTHLPERVSAALE